MLPSVDNKKYAQDTRLFQDAVVQDKHFTSFTTSPIMDGIQIKDICIYGPNDVNKLGKVGKTSWDSFTYALMMGHNVWMHINSVQEANRQYDAGLKPAMLSVADANTKVVKQYDHMFFKDIVNAIFETSDRGRADALVEEYDAYWKDIPGTRGYIGKNTVNANTKAEEHLDIEANFDLLKDFQPKVESTKPVLDTSLFEI
jgi:hypothetical protein